MLGFGDGWIFAAYFFCIVTTIVCIICGIINWNKKADTDAETDPEASELIKE